MNGAASPQGEGMDSPSNPLAPTIFQFNFSAIQLTLPPPVGWAREFEPKRGSTKPPGAVLNGAASPQGEGMDSPSNPLAPAIYLL